MKKISLIRPLLAAVALTICSVEERNPFAAHSGNEIAFTIAGEASHASRGFAIGAGNVSSTLPDFQTWAYDAVDGGLYMGASATSGKTVFWTAYGQHLHALIPPLTFDFRL